MLEATLSAQVLAAFFKVYRELGYGFLEAVYVNALFVELTKRGMDVKREVLIEVMYQGVSVGTYRIDLLVSNRIMLEVKSTKNHHRCGRATTPELPEGHYNRSWFSAALWS